MISGVGVGDDTGYASGIPAIKSASDTDTDPQASLQKNGMTGPNADRDGTARAGVTPYDGFGDRFSSTNAQALLDAQETLPATTKRTQATTPDDTGTDAADARNGSAAATPDENPLDTNRDGTVSFVEWQDGQGDNPLDANGDGTVSFVEWLKGQSSGTDLTSDGDQTTASLGVAATSSFE